MTEVFGAPAVHRVRSVESPLSLVASFDYFNTVWQLAFQKPILQLANAERLARLAFPVNSYEEFGAQLSCVAELLRTFQVTGNPKVDRTPLERLRSLLRATLTDTAAADRCVDAVDVLYHVTMIRNGLLQHAGSEHKGAKALANLGMTYPIRDWAEAWGTVQLRLIDALSVLRVELQAHHQASTAE